MIRPTSSSDRRTQHVLANNQPLHRKFTKAAEFPGACTKLANLLLMAPVFKGTGSCITDKSQVVVLADWRDARIMHIFNHNASQLLYPAGTWEISSFGFGNNYAKDVDGRLIPQGIVLQNHEKPRCSFELLEATYSYVLKKLTIDWIEENWEDHPLIFDFEDPQQFRLFIKEWGSQLIDEHRLIALMSSKLSLDPSDIICSNTWMTKSGQTSPGRPYLWIRKTALAKVVDKMGFNFSHKSRSLLSRL